MADIEYEHPEIPAIPEAPPLPLSNLAFALPNRERCCAGCRFSAKEQKDRVCRYDIPHTAMFMVPVMGPPMRPGAPPTQSMQMTTQTWFPVVVDSQWCGKFEAR